MPVVAAAATAVAVVVVVFAGDGDADERGPELRKCARNERELYTLLFRVSGDADSPSPEYIYIYVYIPNIFRARYRKTKSAEIFLPREESSTDT